ncbi:MAG: hypothetical protein JKY66_02370 [Spongiibacteraceae bacterium]|nr:hypothetical protein [Spongiibacteraceae bacterium]
MAIEIGSKNKLNDNLILNAALFNYNYKDYQVITQDPNNFTESLISNAEDVDFFGAELSLQYINKGLKLTANASYLSAKFGSNTTIFDSTVGRTVDVSDLNLKKAPEWTGSLSAAYEWNAPKGAVNLRGYAYASSDFNLDFTPLNNSQGERIDHQTGYARVDLSLSYTHNTTDNLVELYVKNAADNQIRTGFSGISSGFVTYRYDAPRTYGVRFKLNF